MPVAVPGDGEFVLGGVSFGVGQQVRTENGQVVAWLRPEVLPDDQLHRLWHTAAAAYPRTGLWPLITSGLGGDLERPWLSGELFEVEPPLPASEALAVLGRFPEPIGGAGLDEVDERQGELPRVDRLAPGMPGPIRPAESLPVEGAIMLVPAEQPGDVAAVLGWSGPVNHDLSGAQIAAVLRSWHDRFGAFPVGISFDTLELWVSRPPTGDDRDLVAREHYAFCPDNIEQGVPAGQYPEVVGQHHWLFWWD